MKEKIEIYDNHGGIILTGSANAYVATLARAIAGYHQELRFCGKANHTNSGASTMNIMTQTIPAGFGAVAIRKAGNAALVGGEIVSGKYYDFAYDATSSVVQVLNPDISTGGITSTLLADNSVSTAKVQDDAVTYAKMQNVSATSRLLGRKTAGAGDVEECTLSEVLDFIGSAAQGDILYRGASSWARLAAGTSGQYLQTQGVSADPQWATVSQALTKLTSGTVSNVASLDIVLASYTAYRGLMFEVTNFIPATDSTALYARFSTDGGATYDAAAGNYRYSYSEAYAGGVSSVSSASATQIQFAATIGNDAVGGATFMIELMNQTSAALHSRINWHGSVYYQDNNTGAICGTGRRLTAQDTDAIRFLFSSGNITSGTYAVYGLS